MYIIRGLSNIPGKFRGAAATIGNFDGVHLGHQSLFHELDHLAAPHGAPVMAITFEPHPMRLVNPAMAPPRITGVRGKSRWMSRFGVDAMFILPFTHLLAALTPRAFVEEILVGGLALKEVLVGTNFHFGCHGSGNFDVLRELGRHFGFGVHQRELLNLDGEVISSTRVREVVHNRDFSLAARLLGHHFEIEGRVGHGHHRGRSLGFPTANLNLNGLLHPPPGVYIVEGRTEEGWLPGVANVGGNPTFGETEPHLEVHFLRPCGNLYRKVMRIRFHEFLREQIAFPSPSELMRQIARDIARAEAMFAALEGD
ncbi:MAG: riboflavin biosynthesis protein RibF [Magnetococcales bacterium]|nr:riboflavin biosynthesis protein RibF [Magnetococcales bacterium]MBF0156211.1 riboflavin biosynthesis protein RibF [Magnetococcales bacterium]